MGAHRCRWSRTRRSLLPRCRAGSARTRDGRPQAPRALEVPGDPEDPEPLEAPAGPDRPVDPADLSALALLVVPGDPAALPGPEALDFLGGLAAPGVPEVPAIPGAPPDRSVRDPPAAPGGPEGLAGRWVPADTRNREHSRRGRRSGPPTGGPGFRSRSDPSSVGHPRPPAPVGPLGLGVPEMPAGPGIITDPINAITARTTATRLITPPKLPPEESPRSGPPARSDDMTRARMSRR